MGVFLNFKNIKKIYKLPWKFLRIEQTLCQAVHFIKNVSIPKN